MSINRVPKKLYKYIRPNIAVDYKDNIKLKFSQPNECNDPFEFMPQGEYNCTIEEWKNEINNNFDACHKKWILSGRTENKEDYAKLINNVTNIEKIKKNMSFDAKNARDASMDSVGVCCFSTRVDDILMWAHYCDSHKGVVLEVDPKLIANENQWFKVNYSTQRVKIGLTGKVSVEELIGQKSVDWTYEKEWRIFDHLKNLEKKPDDTEKDKYHYLKLIDRKAITKIIIGIESSKTLKNSIKKFAQEFEIPVGRAARDPYKYKINIFDT